MKAKSWYWWLKIAVLLFASNISTTFSRTVYAQIIPDATLGRERSSVTPQGVRDLITGGAVRDTTLFHSFREFNVTVKNEQTFSKRADLLLLISIIMRKPALFESLSGIVFCNSRAAVKGLLLLIQRETQRLGLGYLTCKVALFYSSLRSDHRQEIIQKLQAGQIKVICPR